MQNDTHAVQTLRRKKTRKAVNSRLVVKARCRKVPIENQYLMLGARNYGVAGLAVVGLNGDKRIGGFHGLTGAGKRVVIIICDLLCGIRTWDADCGC